MQWRLLDNDKKDGYWNMALDKAMLLKYQQVNIPTLRFYRWDKATLSLGYFQKLPPEILEICQINDIPVVRRPTGGRAVLHDDELTYSIVAPCSLFSSERDILKIYHRIAETFVVAFTTLGLQVELSASDVIDKRALFCFSEPSYYEISVAGKKIIGSAQKYYRNVLLQHGSLPLTRNLDRVSALFGEEQVHKWTSLKEITGSSPDLQRIKNALTMAFVNSFDIHFTYSDFLAIESEKARELRPDLFDEFNG